MKPELSTDLITSEWSADGAVVVCIDGSPLRPGEITWAAEFAHRHGLWMRIVFVAPSADLNTSHRRPACSWSHSDRRVGVARSSDPDRSDLRGEHRNSHRADSWGRLDRRNTGRSRRTWTDMFVRKSRNTA